MASHPLVGAGRPRGFAAFLVALVAAGLLVILSTWRDYGITWDESVQARYGDLVLDDFFATTRYGADGMFPESPIVHVVGREGAAFTVIRAGKGAKRPPP